MLYRQLLYHFPSIFLRPLLQLHYLLILVNYSDKKATLF